jgi:hypothetical protein
MIDWWGVSYVGAFTSGVGFGKDNYWLFAVGIAAFCLGAVFALQAEKEQREQDESQIKDESEPP